MFDSIRKATSNVQDMDLSLEKKYHQKGLQTFLNIVVGLFKLEKQHHMYKIWIQVFF
jgi:hypothetical protein